MSRKPRRNDAPWRNECIALYGEWCRVCGTSRDIQLDHVVPRSQGGPSVVENGLPLCRPHHEDKTNGKLKFDRDWFTDEQLTWLEQVGWVAWDDEGRTYGHGWRHFNDVAA